jgi:hypothetical protein
MTEKSIKPIQASHINFVACDTHFWEQAAAFQIE